MLQYLQIENIALIERLVVEPCSRLNALTGETGAGKSIIIDSINAVLGGRVNRELIRTGQEKATIEAVFDVSNNILPILEDLGIECSSDDNIILTREFSLSGKSICRINGRIVNASVLSDVGQHLVDMHGQHDNQSLLKPSLHLNILDTFCGKDLANHLDLFRSKLTSYKLKEKELIRLKNDVISRERKLDLLKYQINEINSANIVEGEDIELEGKRLLMKNASKVSEGVMAASATLSEEEKNALDFLATALSRLQQAAQYSELVSTLHTRLSEQYYILEDLSRELRDIQDVCDFSPEELEEIEFRLDLLGKLKKKYGPTLIDVMNFLESAKIELEEIDISPEQIENMEMLSQQEKMFLMEDATSISQKRKQIAGILETRIAIELEELEMKDAGLKVDFTETELQANGMDKIEFLFSANRGEPLKPLSKIASGGEMSRVMLAIKSILAETDSISLLIFDEIDSGISGVAAQKVGERLKALTRSHQVICVTHHAQIAAMADKHFFVSKNYIDGKTLTALQELTGENRSSEIARLLSGADITDISIQHANELLKSGLQI